MPRKRQLWFRFYVEAVYDRKLRRMAPAERWLWVAVLAAARQSPIPGMLMISERQAMDAADLADVAGMAERDVRRAIPKFLDAGILDKDENIGCWVVPNFLARQFESDSSTERTAKHRSNERGKNVPTSRVGTPPETETDTYLVTAAGGVLTTGAPKLAAAAAARPIQDPNPPAQLLAEQALRILAERRLAAKRDRVDSPGSWIHAALKGLRVDHAERLASPEATTFTTAQELADWLEPPHRPADQGRREYAYERPPCTNPDCVNGWIPTDTGDGGVARCPACAPAVAEGSAR